MFWVFWVHHPVYTEELSITNS